MYLVKTITEDVAAEAVKAPPFGPAFDPKIAGAADRMEVWGSRAADPGPDACEFRLFAGERRIGTRTMPGY